MNDRLNQGDASEGARNDRAALSLSVVALVLAVVVPTCVLIEYRAEFRESGFTAASPFVYQRVALFQVLLTLPASLFAAWQLSRLFRLPPLLLAIVSVAFALSGGLLVDQIAAVATTRDLHGRHIARLVWVACLQLPWALTCVMALRKVDAQHFWSGWRSIVWVDALIVTMLLVLPVIFLNEELARQEVLIGEEIGNQQYLMALNSSRCAATLGADTIVGQPAAEVVAGLSQEVARLREAVSITLPATADDATLLPRAVNLISLGEFDEAERTLQKMSGPRAMFHTARISELRRNWPEAVDRFGAVITELSEQGASDEKQLALFRAAMERRVNNLRRDGRVVQAEDELKQALIDWPAANDRLLLQLAFHYKLAGRGADAIRYFQKAAEANAEFGEIANSEIESLKGQAQGCLIRINRGATR